MSGYILASILVLSSSNWASEVPRTYSDAYALWSKRATIGVLYRVEMTTTVHQKGESPAVTTYRKAYGRTEDRYYFECARVAVGGSDKQGERLIVTPNVLFHQALSQQGAWVVVRWKAPYSASDLEETVAGSHYLDDLAVLLGISTRVGTVAFPSLESPDELSRDPRLVIRTESQSDDLLHVTIERSVPDPLSPTGRSELRSVSKATIETSGPPRFVAFTRELLGAKGEPYFTVRFHSKYEAGSPELSRETVMTYTQQMHGLPEKVEVASRIESDTLPLSVFQLEQYGITVNAEDEGRERFGRMMPVLCLSAIGFILLVLSIFLSRRKAAA
jgi:hypothetical protein